MMRLKLISKNTILTLTLLSTLLFTACSSFVAATASGPIKEDYGERTLGTIVEDNTIESKAKALIKNKTDILNESNIQFHSFNTILLITGQVNSEKSKQVISQLTQKIRHVKRIHNELEVLPASSFSSRLHDSMLSTKISSRLVFTDDIDSSRIDTIVENGTVYLMGLVTQEEAARAANALQKVSGLKKIVRVFEYINNQTS